MAVDGGSRSERIDQVGQVEREPRLSAGCLASALVVCTPVVAYVVASYNVRPVNSPDRWTTSDWLVGLAWLAVPVTVFVMRTWSVRWALTFAVVGSVVLVLTFVTVRFVHSKGAQTGLRGESASQGAEILRREIAGVLGPVVGDRWRFFRGGEAYSCFDPTFGHARPAQEVSLGVRVDGGVNGRELDLIVGGLHAAGWQVEVREQGPTRGGRTRFLGAAKEGYRLDSAPVFDDPSVVSREPLNNIGDLWGSTPCLRSD